MKAEKLSLWVPLSTVFSLTKAWLLKIQSGGKGGPDHMARRGLSAAATGYLCCFATGFLTGSVRLVDGFGLKHTSSSACLTAGALHLALSTEPDCIVFYWATVKQFFRNKDSGWTYFFPFLHVTRKLFLISYICVLFIFYWKLTFKIININLHKSVSKHLE